MTYAKPETPMQARDNIRSRTSRTTKAKVTEAKGPVPRPYQGEDGYFKGDEKLPKTSRRSIDD